MAIGDSFSVFMGTGAVNRQPSAGVFEEVSAMIKSGSTDQMSIYNGSTTGRITDGANVFSAPQGNAAAVRGNPYNMAIKIGNSIYLRKEGTTDLMAVSGVQVDA